jgi:hypothetical protein
MTAMSRREFVKNASADLAVAGFLAAGGARLTAAPLGLPIGSQTYPHRMMIRDGNFPGLLKTRRGTFGFIDVSGGKLVGDRKLECELTVKGGQVVWDRNGISRSLWTEMPK